jgi:hypothetical protein
VHFRAEAAAERTWIRQQSQPKEKLHTRTFSSLRARAAVS